MNVDEKPVVIVSKCIEFDHCRWNGQIIGNEVIKHLKPFVHFLPVCPEVEIGLGIPRQAIRLTEKDGVIRLISSMEGKDLTESMILFGKEFTPELPAVDGFILKSRSPSCGLGTVKVYPGPGRVILKHAHGVGFFADAMKRRFPHAIFEDEGRLTNLRIREHFFTALFTNHRFSQLPQTMAALVNFHSDNKYLFMSCNQATLKKMGVVVANHQKLEIAEVFYTYRNFLTHLLGKMPRIGMWINTLLHMFGYVSPHLQNDERHLFIQIVEQYRNQQIPLITLTKMLHVWALRFEKAYLLRQTLLTPYPSELLSIHNSGHGRIG